MRAVLRRETKSGEGAYGKIFDEKGTFLFTCLERLFDGVPKIAPGVHPLIPYNSPKRGYIVPLLNAPEDEGHFFEIHIANYPTELDGCIAPGIGYGYTNDKQINMVTDSKTAWNRFMALDFNEIEVIDFS